MLHHIPPHLTCGMCEIMTIATFGNRCLSAIGGEKQRSRLAGWVQLSAEVAPGPTEYRQRHPVHTDDSGTTNKNIDDAGNLYEKRHCNNIVFFFV